MRETDLPFFGPPTEETKPKVIIKPGEEGILAPTGKETKTFIFGYPVQNQQNEKFTPCEKIPIDHL